MSIPTVVDIDGIKCHVFCSQEKGRKRWVANGDFNGHNFSGSGASHSLAIAKWREAAYRSND